MDRIINVKVSGHHLSKDNNTAGARGEGNVTILRITFDANWDSFAKTITFWDAHGANPVKRTLTTDLIENIAEDTRVYFVPIPQEPLAIAGKLTFAIEGFVDDKRQRSVYDELVIEDSPVTASGPIDPTPTQAEQLQKQIDGIVDDIQNAVLAEVNANIAMGVAENSASSASNSSELAKKYAEDAETYSNKAQNAVGKTSYIGDNGNWFAWDGEQGAFYDTGVKAQAGSTVYYGENPPPEADVWIDPNGTGITIDDELSETSENPVQNKVVRAALVDLVNKKAPVVHAHQASDIINLTEVFPVDEVLDSESENPVQNKTVNQSLNSVYFSAIEYVDNKIGDIETALDNIIAIQNDLIGGEAV